MNMVLVHPPDSPRIRRKRRARRVAILGTAMDLVAQRGVEGLTLQSIADALDYSVGALYRYFPSKGVLVAELQREVIRVLDAKVALLWSRCEEQLAGERGPAAALLPLVTLPFLYERVAEAAPEHFGLLSDSLGDPRQLIEDEDARRVFADARPIFEGMAARFEAAVRARALGPGEPLRRALVLWASMHGVVQLRKMGRVDPLLIDTGAMLASLVEALFLGWGAQPDALERALRMTGEGDLTAIPVAAADFAAVSLESESLHSKEKEAV
jgi:AcrR family transcriptional regulator